MDSIKIIVNGKSFLKFKSASISKSLEAIGGVFEFEVANDFIAGLPFRDGDISTMLNTPIEIFINNMPFMTGIIDVISPSYSKGDHSLTFSGRDKTADIVDSTVYNNTTYKGEISFKQVLENVMRDNGIPNILVTDTTKGKIRGFSSSETVNAKIGETLFEFMDRIARVRGAVLTADENGFINIYRNSGIYIGASLTNERGNNKRIKSASSRIDYTNRFKTIIVKSQDSLESGGENIEGKAIDEDVTRNVTKVIISDKVVDIDGATDMAYWERNKRKSDSVTYDCTVVGFSATDKAVWLPNMLVDVNDSFAGINATMLIKSVNFNLSKEDGTTTYLEFVSSDSFALNQSNLLPKKKEDSFA